MIFFRFLIWSYHIILSFVFSLLVFLWLFFFFFLFIRFFITWFLENETSKLSTATAQVPKGLDPVESTPFFKQSWQGEAFQSFLILSTLHWEKLSVLNLKFSPVQKRQHRNQHHQSEHSFFGSLTVSCSEAKLFKITLSHKVS